MLSLGLVVCGPGRGWGPQVKGTVQRISLSSHRGRVGTSIDGARAGVQHWEAWGWDPSRRWLRGSSKQPGMGLTAQAWAHRA